MLNGRGEHRRVPQGGELRSCRLGVSVDLALVGYVGPVRTRRRSVLEARDRLAFFAVVANVRFRCQGRVWPGSERLERCR